jgi:ribosome maturation factor RimP
VATKQEILERLIRPVVSGLGYECWGVALLSQGRHSLLRVYIEKPSSQETEGDAEPQPDSESGIVLADCEKVSRQLSAVLDVEDPIAGDYTLEVSSPGMDRPLYTLDQYRRFSGHLIALTLRMPFDGRRKYQGLLKGVEQDEVVIQVEQEELLFPFESIEKANVVPQFD